MNYVSDLGKAYTSPDSVSPSVNLSSAPPWLCCEGSTCSYLSLLSVFWRCFRCFFQPCSLHAPSKWNLSLPLLAMVQTSLKLWVQNFLPAPKLHYSPAFEPQGFGHLSFSPGLWNRQMWWVWLPFPRTRQSPHPLLSSLLAVSQETWGPSPHCVSLESSLVFSGPQLFHLWNGREEFLSAISLRGC